LALALEAQAVLQLHLARLPQQLRKKLPTLQIQTQGTVATPPSAPTSRLKAQSQAAQSLGGMD
jgi:hypothetical protein